MNNQLRSSRGHIPAVFKVVFVLLTLNLFNEITEPLEVQLLMDGGGPNPDHLGKERS